MENASSFPNRKNKIKQSAGDRTFGIVNFVLVTLLMLVLVYPFYYCIILAFNDGMDALNPGIYFFPRVITMNNFKAAIGADGLLWSAFISVSRTVLGTSSAVIVTAAFAYAVSKSYLRFRPFYFTFMIIPMFFSGGMVPTFILMDKLNLLNNFLVYIIPGMFSVFYSLIFMTYFKDLPPSLEESAKLDGANHIKIFFQLILPVSMPVIAAVCVFVAVGHWNSWMDTLLYARNDKSLHTLAFNFAAVAQRIDALARQAKEAQGAAGVVAGNMRGATGMSTQLAAMIISVAPVMAVYPFFQKYFVRGVMIGAVKG